MFVCLDVCRRTVRITTFPTVFLISLIPTKLGTQVLCVSMHKTVEQIFRILLLNFFGIFVKFYISSGTL